MKTTKFKTTIQCTGCVNKVTSALNETAGEGNWQVDLNDPTRTLTVAGEFESSNIIEALLRAGYRAEEI